MIQEVYVPKPVSSYKELYDHCGDPHKPDFAKNYIVSLAQEIAGGKIVQIECHKNILQPLKQAFNEITEKGALDLIKTYNGCFVIRNVRGETTESIHSWGYAADFCADEYPLESKKRFPDVVVNAFRRAGFFYGGDFYHRPDGMHFQWTAPHTI